MKKTNAVSREYSIAATEILILLENFSEELKNKIPVQLVTFFQEVSAVDYEPKFDISQGIEKIELTDKAKALLAMIYRNYLCSEEERKEFDKKLFENEEKYQQELREKYSPDNIFKNNPKKEEPRNNQNTALIECKKEKWYHRIFEKIRQVFLKK